MASLRGVRRLRRPHTPQRRHLWCPADGLLLLHLPCTAAFLSSAGNAAADSDFRDGDGGGDGGGLRPKGRQKQQRNHQADGDPVPAEGDERVVLHITQQPFDDDE